MITVDFCTTGGRILPFKGGQSEMQHRRVVVALDHDEYAALECRAQREDRDPWQQARHILRRALTADPPAGPIPCDGDGPRQPELAR